MSNKIELLKKIKALADGGVGGEKTNAEKKLREMMNKLGLTEEDLEEEKIVTRIFETGNLKVNKNLFGQIAASVIEDVKIYGSTVSKKIRLIDCTVAQQVEIEAKFAFYKTRYKHDLETFYLAFIQRNRLWPKYSKDQEQKEMTPKEEAKWVKAQMMSEGLDKHHYRKQIGGKL